MCVCVCLCVCVCVCVCGFMLHYVINVNNYGYVKKKDLCLCTAFYSIIEYLMFMFY